MFDDNVIVNNKLNNEKLFEDNVIVNNKLVMEKLYNESKKVDNSLKNDVIYDNKDDSTSTKKLKNVETLYINSNID